ncbi:MAG: glutamate 5-kinase [Thermodesulfobacteriota bacterium]|mgnify:CR=1 FL=1|nr:glutamate 5-kinase [Thermodesulfobacteriota bacterium]MEE2975439.1 glutamate 5-kinase [Thermodesulfobacteriota bacterium]|tara:strand:+ start:7807 stop:8940 length:1134 start_codon:yes stop_codon:yes gene_type:complete
MEDIKNILKKAKRVVIKIGSKALADKSGRISYSRIKFLASSVKYLRSKNIDCLIVSSGAILAGNELFSLNIKKINIVKKQAIASLGQLKLMSYYIKAFEKEKVDVSQLLLTNDIFSNRKRFLNTRATILELIKMKIVPVINENDTVSVDEIMFGDNDILASKVASMMDADCLILLTDTNGLYSSNPKKNKQARLIQVIKEDKFDSTVISDTSEEISFGGMKSKIEASLEVSKFGIPTIIANGTAKDELRRIFNYEDVGTVIMPSSKKIKNRKKWIGIGPKSSGRLIIDQGASDAIIQKGKSLLPSGVLKVEGKFLKGAQVICVNSKTMKEIAKGLISYDSEEINQIKGMKSKDIEKVLGYKYSDEIMNRDNMVTIKD